MNEDFYKDWDKHELNIQPTCNMIFSDNKGTEIGKLDWTEGVMKFEGKAEESAKVFFDYFFQFFNERKNDENK